uniref:Uncharacterized protein n=1 Tax=Accipiter nisus TaxID=211598 RepID=A0A8B9RV27_9AVES
MHSPSPSLKSSLAKHLCICPMNQIREEICIKTNPKELSSTLFKFCTDIAILKDHPKVRGLAIGSWLPFHQPKSITVHVEIPILSVGTCLSNSRMAKF